MTDNEHANAVNEQIRQAEENDEIPASSAERSSIRLVVDGEQLTADNPIDYLVMLLIEGKRYDGNWDGDETEVARWAVAQWCQELGWAPDLRDYRAGEQVERGDEIACLDTAFYGTPQDSNEGDDSNLPTIAYQAESGERRRVRYERTPGKPHQAERHVDRWDGRTWVPCGGEELDELVVEGEHRAAVSLMEGP
ncbi:hypothetical protein C464_06110 [Halorubrum coriense DSM 10284]|uniref:Uncharacterized protein n=1 Tax=Halorubrum coriense DSM 10284 TaxID=1227466 RepID=M0EPZ4_9EURY|nr:hypothetical protein [Halorubrum coriense]ELZ48962.1 hypothetical protein C464_06110 [Halorubrum coriense DSM 10284]QRG24147.1 hypothetical protein HrrHm1_180 [Halorubrum virus Humcor1]